MWCNLWASPEYAPAYRCKWSQVSWRTPSGESGEASDVKPTKDYYVYCLRHGLSFWQFVSTRFQWKCLELQIRDNKLWKMFSVEPTTPPRFNYLLSFYLPRNTYKERHTMKDSWITSILPMTDWTHLSNKSFSIFIQPNSWGRVLMKYGDRIPDGYWSGK